VQRALSSLSLMALLGALCLDVKAADEAAPIRLATVAPLGTPWSEQLDESRLRAEAVGFALTTVFRPADCSEWDLLAAMGLGEPGKLGPRAACTLTDPLDGALLPLPLLAEAFGLPTLRLLELPMLLSAPPSRANSRDDDPSAASAALADRAIESVMMDEAARRLESKGLVVIGWSEIGFRHLFTSGAALTAEDRAGLKVRAAMDPLAVGILRPFGWRDIQEVAASNLVPWLRTGQVDGFDGTPLFAGNLLAMSDAAGRVNTITLTHHSYEAAVIVLRKDRWDALSTPQQIALRVNLVARGAQARRAVRALQLDLLRVLSSQGREVIRLNAEEHARVATAAQEARDMLTREPEQAAVYALLREALADTL
jgi:TRAP-type C4-dicarboxylate transport system substrate-binding protein